MKPKISRILPVVAVALPAAAAMSGSIGVVQMPDEPESAAPLPVLTEDDQPVLFIPYEGNKDSLYYRREEDDRTEYPFYAMARAYDDGHVAVRWIATEYVPWRLASEFGYDIVRVDFSDGLRADTLAKGLKPMPIEEMWEKFGAQDSIAGMAAQLLYGKGSESLNGNTANGNVVLDVYFEQQSRFADAMMLAEWRPDLAEAMAVRYNDHTAKPGHKYEYSIYPKIPNSTLRTSPASVIIQNIPYERKPFEPAMTDSLLVDGHMVDLYWENDPEYSAYDVERRAEGETQWTRLNKNPFVTLATDDQEILKFSAYTDPGVPYGTHYYRVRGIDTFGDRGPWSPEYEVVTYDKQAPVAPQIRYFDLHRDDKNVDDMTVNIYWSKTEEEPDLAGYNIYYYHRSRGELWNKLNPELIPRDKREYTTDVSGFASGYVIVAAVDSMGNQAPSMPMELTIADLTPPAPPTGIKSLMFPDGTVALQWNKNKERDIAGYQLYFANDTTHKFMAIGPMISDTTFVDSIAVVGVNQKNIYYRLRAFDYAGNQSNFSDIHTVQRIVYTKPENCVPDSTWQTDSVLYIDWRCFSAHTTKEYNLYRRIEGQKDWTLVQTVDADDAPHNIVHTWDSPNYNTTKRYFYGLETVNLIGESSGIDHQVSFWHKGPMVLEVPIELTGETNANGRVILHWQPYGDLPIGYSYVVQMRREGEDHFREIYNYNQLVQDADISILREGQKAQFQVILKWKDGRVSTPSNVFDVTLTIPRDEE